jgi:hypothetical protein
MRELKLRWKLGIAVPAVLLVIGAVLWFASTDFQFWVRAAYLLVRPVPRVCKQRATEFQARVERIRKEARNSLKPGATSGEIASFYASESIPLTIGPMGYERYASGQVYVTGLPECETIACGNDSALIGVQVEIDANGTVVSEPVVVGMYTDCL